MSDTGCRELFFQEHKNGELGYGELEHWVDHLSHWFGLKLVAHSMEIVGSREPTTTSTSAQVARPGRFRHGVASSRGSGWTDEWAISRNKRNGRGRTEDGNSPQQ